MTDAPNITAEERMASIDAILDTPGGPVVIGTGCKALQEASDAAVRRKAPL